MTTLGHPKRFQEGAVQLVQLLYSHCCVLTAVSQLGNTAIFTFGEKGKERAATRACISRGGIMPRSRLAARLLPAPPASAATEPRRLSSAATASRLISSAAVAAGLPELASSAPPRAARGRSPLLRGAGVPSSPAAAARPAPCSDASRA